MVRDVLCLTSVRSPKFSPGPIGVHPRSHNAAAKSGSVTMNFQWYEIGAKFRDVAYWPARCCSVHRQQSIGLVTFVSDEGWGEDGSIREGEDGIHIGFPPCLSDSRNTPPKGGGR